MTIKPRLQFVLFIGAILQTNLALAVEEVQVTAQLKGQSILEVPISIGVYDRATLDQMNITSLQDLESVSPSLNFGRGDRSSRGEITIRGVGDFSRNIGYEARVSVYIDDVPAGRSSAYDQDLADIESVEIIRGPQGTFSGSGTVAGVIRINTTKPSDNFEAGVASTIGNFGYRKNEILINVPISDEVAARAQYSVTDKDGHIQNTLLDRDLNGFHKESGFIKFQYRPQEELTIQLSTDRLKETGDISNAVGLEGAGFGAYDPSTGVHVVAHDAQEFGKRDLFGSRFSINYSDTIREVKFISGFRENSFSELNEEDYSPLDIATSFIDEELKQWTNELRYASSAIDGRINYVSGISYKDQDVRSEGTGSGGAFFPVPNSSVNTSGDVQTNSHALYLHLDGAVTRELTISGGVRYIRENKDIQYSITDTTGLFITENNITDSRKDSQSLPKVSIQYEHAEDVFSYLTFAKGYKSGGWNADFISTLENFEYGAEEATSYEVGLKAKAFSDRLGFNFSLFHTEYDDFQVFQFLSLTGGGTALSLTNASSVSTEGVEVDSRFTFMDSIRAVLNASYTEAEFDEFKDGGGLGTHFDGRDLPYAPKVSYFIALEYVGVGIGDAEIKASIDYRRSGQYFSNPDNLPENLISSRYTINTFLELSYKGFKADLWARNITNEVSLRQKSVSFLGQPRGTYEQPRTYGLSFNYEWD